MRILGLILLIMTLYLAYDIYFGRNGVAHHAEVARALESAQQRSRLLTQRNQSLQEELRDLRQGNSAIEELARTELGLIRENEVFYRIIIHGPAAPPQPLPAAAGSR